MLILIFRSVSKNTLFENRLNDGGVNFMNALNNITEDLQMLKSRQLYIPHYGRDRYAYDVVNNYLSESFI